VSGKSVAVSLVTKHCGDLNLLAECVGGDEKWQGRGTNWVMSNMTGPRSRRLCAPNLEVGWGKLRRRTSTSRCSCDNTSLTDRSTRQTHGVNPDECSPKQRDTVAPEFASVALRMRKTGTIPSELAAPSIASLHPPGHSVTAAVLGTAIQYTLSHTLPQFGATHHPPTIAVYKFCSPNVSALLATTPGAPPSHVFIPP